MSDPYRTATTRAPSAMVCSPDALASQAGLGILRAGGSAADAAVATSAVLAVTAQHMCGMGGDLWALVHHEAGEPPEALNASGRAGSGADADALRAAGHTRMPTHGLIHAVPVPGCVDGWTSLHDRFGRLPLAEVLQPAIHYARHGFPASPLLAAMIPLVEGVPGAEDFFPMGGARSGTTITRPGMAEALESVSSGGRDGFYLGPAGEGLIDLSDGEHTVADLRSPHADWVDPISIEVWDHRIWTVPPNSQGYLTLAGCGVFERCDPPTNAGVVDLAGAATAHLQIEAARAVAHDRIERLHEHADVAAMLDGEALRETAASIDPGKRRAWADTYHDGDTIYLCTADDAGMGVSLIQSNAAGFGVGLTIPGTGIFLHNRGLGFSLEPGHPAEYGPGRRPPSTLAPTLVTSRDNDLRALMGTMGGDGQPQILLQVLSRLLAANQSPGRAVGTARWLLADPDPAGFDTWEHPDEVVVRLEADVPADWRHGLTDRGHQVMMAGVLDSGFGHAHTIERVDGHWAGAADPRALIGAAVGY